MTSYVCECCGKEQQVAGKYLKSKKKKNPHLFCRTCLVEKKSERFKLANNITDLGRNCRVCGTFKEWKLFYNRGKDIGTCKLCKLDQFKTKWESDSAFKAKTQKRARVSHLKTKYGITEEHYDELVLVQNGKCAICSKEERLVIDHEHSTGIVRGLLCNACNKGLGLFFDSQDLLLKAKDYLCKEQK